MHPIEYASPTTREQAVKLLGTDPAAAAPLAGGSDLLALMKDGVETPKRLVSLKGIAGLTGVRSESGGLRIGALTVLDDLAADAALGFEYPAVTAAAGRLAGPQIRNVATLGGNLLQRPRCWYYRNGFGLLALRDGKSMVAEGDYRYHAILGNTEGSAYFVSPSTLAPVLVAVGAQAVLFGPQGERRIELEKLYRIPKQPGEREHDLRPGEILTEIHLPPAAGRKIASYEVRQRTSLDWSLATASVALEMTPDGNVTQARVVLGQVAPMPWVSAEAAAVLKGNRIDAALATKAGEATVQKALAPEKNHYKVQLAKTAVKRALIAAAGIIEDEG